MTTRKLVLVLDDDPSVLAAVERMLRVHGFDTEVFNTVESFLDRANLCGATCLVLDIHLDGMSGIELRRQLTRSGIELPVVFITAQAESGRSQVTTKDPHLRLQVLIEAGEIQVQLQGTPQP